MPGTHPPRRRAGRGLVLFAVLLLVALTGGAGAAQGVVDGAPPVVSLPPGFVLSVFAAGIQDARFLSYSPQGDLYVGQLLGSRSAISILPDRDHDGVADRTLRVAADLNSPNNVAFRPPGFGTVFAAGAFDRVKVYTDTRGDLSFADSAVLVSGLSNVTSGRHKTKTVAYGPDGRLYLSKGSFADDPPQPDPNAGIRRYDAGGGGAHLFATGLRNTVGFAWDPVGGGMWGADNGSDDLGRDEPHDELNLLVDGGNYGWPNCIDNGHPNPQTAPVDCRQTRAPAVLLPAHAGALGVAFYTGGSFPAHYWGGLFVAVHSIQYPEQRGVYFIPFRDGRPAGPPEPFLTQANNRWLGLAVDPYDGALMISDDREGRIFRVRYTGAPPARPPAAAPPPAVPGHPAPRPVPPLPGVARTFPATGHTLAGPFLQYWFWNGGLARYGYPISDPLTETLADGHAYLVQYTERARLEYHPEDRGTAAEVQLGRLGADLAAGRPGAAFAPATPAPGATFVAATRHNLSGPLAAYWAANGGVPVFGYPLGEPFAEASAIDGKPYTVQYFERGRLEYHPEFAGTGQAVLLGLLGAQSYAARYGAPPGATGAPSPTPVPPTPPATSPATTATLSGPATAALPPATPAAGPSPAPSATAAAPVPASAMPAPTAASAPAGTPAPAASGAGAGAGAGAAVGLVVLVVAVGCAAWWWRRRS